MDKKILAASLLERYEKISATKSYIFGFVENGNVYACKVEDASKILPFIVRVGSASRGAGFSLRYNPSKQDKKLIMISSVETKVLCSFEYMEENKKFYNNNRGNMFEVLSAKTFGGKLSDKKNAKFTDCGDMNINGKEYQAKFGCNKGAATFTNERTLENLEKNLINN